MSMINTVQYVLTVCHCTPTNPQPHIHVQHKHKKINIDNLRQKLQSCIYTVHTMFHFNTAAGADRFHLEFI